MQRRSRFLGFVGGVAVLFAVGCGSNKDHPAPIDPASGGAGGSGGSGGSAASAYALELYQKPTSWTQLVHTSAVDSTGHLYLTDGSTVYVVDTAGDGAASVYLSNTEVEVATLNEAPRIKSVDVGPDDLLYLLHDDSTELILKATAAHAVKLAVTVADLGGWDDIMAVETPTSFLVLNYNGLYRVATAGSTQLQDANKINSGCSDQDIETTQTGTVYVLTGCTRLLLGGTTDASGTMGVIADEDTLSPGQNPHFGGIGRDGHGGAVLNAELQTYSVDADGNLKALDFTPSMPQIEGFGYRFYNAAVSVGPDGSIFLITDDSVYRATPPG